jgi:hypothetical protein
VGPDPVKDIAQQMLDLRTFPQKLDQETWDRARSNLTAGSLVAVRP